MWGDFIRQTDGGGGGGSICSPQQQTMSHVLGMQHVHNEVMNLQGRLLTLISLIRSYSPQLLKSICFLRNANLWKPKFSTPNHNWVSSVSSRKHHILYKLIILALMNNSHISTIKRQPLNSLSKIKSLRTIRYLTEWMHICSVVSVFQST